VILLLGIVHITCSYSPLISFANDITIWLETGTGICWTAYPGGLDACCLV